MDGELRDVRTSPESPAPWPDELSNPTFRCCSLQLPFYHHLAGNGPQSPVPPTFLQSLVTSRGQVRCESRPCTYWRELRD